MARAAPAKKTAPPKPKRERGAMYAQALDAIALLVEKPHRPMDLMETLGLPRRNIERMLRGIQAAGLELEVERFPGQGAYYRLPREVLKKRLRV